MDSGPLEVASARLEEMLSGNKLVVKPRVIWEVLEALQRLSEAAQVTVLHQLLLTSQQVLHNPSALALDSQAQPHTVLDFLLSYYVSAPSPAAQAKAMELIAALVEHVGVRRSNTYFLYKHLAQSRTDASLLRASLQALRTILQPTRQAHPSNYFYFSGLGSGIEVSTRAFEAFPFVKGISMCVWLRLEEYQTCAVSRLFVFHSKEYGGLEAYFVRSKLYYRTLPAADYMPPVEGSNGILLHEFQPDTWTFLAFEHERTLGARQSLRVVVDGEEVLNTTMDMPKPKAKTPEFTKAGLCLDFTGQVACVMVFEGAIEVQKMKAIYSHYNYGPEGQDSLRSLFRILDKTLVPKLVLFYHPLRAARGLAYEGAKEADGRLIGASGAKLVPPSRMSYLGGICSLLPIVSRINEVQGPERFDLLMDWAQLLFICLKDRPENQMEALSLKFFKVLAEVLAAAPVPAISPEFVKLISDLNFALMPHLREQLAVHFLWALELWTRTDEAVQIRLWELLKYLYNTAPKALSKTVGVSKILDLLSQHFDLKDCCPLHGGAEGRNLAKQIEPLLSIMETVMMSGGESAVKDMKALPAFLFSKPAPCVQKQLLSLIRSLISTRPGEIVGPSPQALAKAFLEARGMELLLFLLSNSPSDVARMSLACVDTLLTHHTQLVTSEFLQAVKSQPFSEKDLLAFIGAVMIPKPEPEVIIEIPPPAPKGIKAFNFALSEEDLEQPPEKEELSAPPQPPSMINRRKPNIRFQFGGEEEEEELKSAPKPPSLKSKKMEFAFPEDDPEPSKLDPPKRVVKSFSSRKGLSLSAALEIDTEKVNENYTYGGGEQAVVRDEGEDALFNEVRELARECLKYMHGELVQDDELRLFPLPPVSMRPQSVRGIKHIDFLSTMSRPIESISEESVDLSPLASPKAEVRSPVEEPIYRTILEMVLHRQLAEGALLDDTDTIANPLALELLFSLAAACSMALRHKVLQDLLMLTKWNSVNSSILAGSQAWHLFVLSQLSLAHSQASPELALVWDMGTRLQTLVLKQVLLVDEEGWKCISRMLTWAESQSSATARLTVRHLLESLIDALKSNTMGCRANLTSTLWKNVVSVGFLLEELLLRGADRFESEAVFPPRTLAASLADNGDTTLLAAYFDLLDPLWPLSLFESSDDFVIVQAPDFEQLTTAIARLSRDSLKLDLQLLLFEPSGDLKNRGVFLKTAVYLALLGLAGSQDSQSGHFWATHVERLAKLILLVSEASKKQCTSAMLKHLAGCFLFITGALHQIMARQLESSIPKGCLANVLSCLFAVYLQAFQSAGRDKLKTPGRLCQDLADSVLSSAPGAPLLSVGELESMKRREFQDLELLVEQEEWGAGLDQLFQNVQTLFLSEAKLTQVSLSRRKQADALSAETRALDIKKDEVLRNLQNRVLSTAAEKSDKEDQRRNSVLVYEQEKARQRKEHWKRLSAKLTQWRGAWQTTDNVSLQPYDAMDAQLARPFLKIRSESARRMLGEEERGSLVDNPTEYLNEVASRNKIRKATASAQPEEDESSQDIEEVEPPEALKVGASLLSYYANEPHLLQRECGWVTPMYVRYGLLQLVESKTEKKLRFILDEHGDKKFQSHIAMFKYCPPPNKSFVKEWSLDSLREVLPRTYVLRHTAFECFFVDGRSVLFNFSSEGDREKIVKKIARMRRSAVPLVSIFKQPSVIKLVKQKDLTERWLCWKLSNFEYIMHLNFLAGRSFNDLTQYPVFPWVVADYTGTTLDLRSPRTYRDLAKPMGALGSESRYNFFRERFNSIDPMHGTPKFHFGSHYSNPGIVLYYLLRMFPFTEAEKELQGGRFDLPDRLFMSVAESFRSAIEDISDVRELIPEFYFLPEVLLNKDRLDLGTTQGGVRVDNVQLPSWAANAYDFVRIHREILESDQVSYSLHQWIDLIFGYKQRGSEAEKALNTFYYMTYEESVDLDNIEDEKLRVSTEAQIVNFGKTPAQLFDKPHPQRQSRIKLQPGPSIVSPGAQLKIYYPATRKQPQKTPNLFNYHELPPRALVKARFCNDNRIVALRNNGTLVIYRWWSTPVMGDFKTPFTCAIEKEKKLGRDYRSAGIETKDRSVPGLNAPVLLLAEGNIVMQGGYWDGRISVQKSSEHEQPTPSCNHYNTVACVDIDQEEHTAVTGSKDGDCIVWQVEAEYWKARWHFIEHDGPVSAVCISSALNAFASCSEDGSCNVYSLRKGRLLAVLRHPEGAPWHNVVFSTAAPAKVILFSAKTNVLYAFSVNGELIHKAHERASFVISPLVVRDLNQTEYLVYGTEIGEVVIRAVGTFAVVKRVTVVNGIPILTLLTTQDLRFLLAGCADGELTVLTDPTATLSLFESQWQSSGERQVGSS